MAGIDDFINSLPDRSGALNSDGGDTGTPDASTLTPANEAPAAPADDTDYGRMTMGEAAWKALPNLPGSAWNAVKAIPEAVYNYDKTGEALKQLGEGAVSKVRGWAGVEQDPAEKARSEAAVNELVAPYTSLFTDPNKAKFKETLVKDPFSILTTAAMPVTGGASAALKGAEMLGKAGTIGKALSIPAKIAGRTGTILGNVMDPVQGGIATAKGIAGLAPKTAKHMASVASNVPPESYTTAFETGASHGPAAVPVKQAFGSFASGNGDVTEFSRRTAKAVDAIKNEDISEWAAKKGALTGATTVDVPFNPVYDAIDEYRSRLSPRGLSLSQGPHDVLDAVENNVINRHMEPAGSPIRRLEGFDQLKQELWQESQKYPSGSAERNAVLAAHAGVKRAIADISPEYLDLMENYQEIQDNLNNLVKTLGTGNKVAANNELARFIRSTKNPQGRQLIAQLAKKDPTIPAMVAGATLAGKGPAAMERLMQYVNWAVNLGGIAATAYTGSPLHALGAMAFTTGQHALQSPSLTGKVAYGAGKASHYAKPAAQAVGKLNYPLRVAEPLAVNMAQDQRQTSPVADESRPYFPAEPQYASGGRTERRSGGRVALDATKVAARLVSAADRAKKAHADTTTPLLQVPDEAIAKALSIANENI